MVVSLVLVGIYGTKKEETFKKTRKSKPDMIIPIRCLSCSKPVAHLWESFTERVQKGEERKKVLDDLGLERYCCRALFMGHVDLIDMATKFKKA